MVAYPMTTPPKFGAVTAPRKESATPASSVATRPPVAHAGSDRRGRSPRFNSTLGASPSGSRRGTGPPVIALPEARAFRVKHGSNSSTKPQTSSLQSPRTIHAALLRWVLSIRRSD